MKNFNKAAIFFCALFILQTNIFSQNIDKDWKKVQSTDRKIWYYAPSLENVKDKKFTLRIIELYTPPITITYVTQPISKSITEYRVNLNIARYGIVEISYYNSHDKLITHYNYDNPKEQTDYKYTYPITDDNTIVSIIKKYIINNELKAK
jgi:hypothetical protein